MNPRFLSRVPQNSGFTLTEVMIALMITMVVMGAVFALLYDGQETFSRELQVSNMNQSARSGMNLISQDLNLSGYNVPPAAAILWNDGGGVIPDELTVIYGDPVVPVAASTCASPTEYEVVYNPRPESLRLADERINLMRFTQWARNRTLLPPRDYTFQLDDEIDEAAMKWRRKSRRRRGSRRTPGGTMTITPPTSSSSSSAAACGQPIVGANVQLDIDSLTPGYADPESAFNTNMKLWAIETSANCDTSGAIGIESIQLTGLPQVVSDAKGNQVLEVDFVHRSTPLELPLGYDNVVENRNCAVIGNFRVVQYRVNREDRDSPMLERRDLTRLNADPDSVAPEGNWTAMAANVEDLQVEYAFGTDSINFFDVPQQAVNPADPDTWITQVRISIQAHSKARNLKGSVEPANVEEVGVRLRKSFSTVVNLRNQSGAAHILNRQDGQLEPGDYN